MDTQSPRSTSRNADRITIGPGDTIDREEFAEFLRTTRERRSITLDQIADETKIASRHLAALERGDVGTWPHGMYRRAMMRAYAESIGLDKEVALEQFTRAFEQPPPQPEAAPPAPEPSPLSPQALLPKVTRPKVTLPKVALPTMTLPRMKVPRVTLPSVTLPRIGRPRLSWTPATQRAVATLVAAAVCLAVARFMFPLGSTPDDSERVIAASAPPPAASAPAPVVQTPVAPAAETAAVAPVADVSEGQLVVTSAPAGARVTVNGVGWGATPITIRYLPLGQKRVRLTMQGYVSEERTVQLGPERPNARVQLTLRSREQASPDRH